ncbi:MAG: tRNA (adenosine(37)-N6)-threonylcarbamoyltransferase complex ATPase subunit type 1 TsaE [Candidatus Omnitrophica bacterium]|nr:tRNA (adenosine(37)-N6)-threonylcarbamoyltransferase complex ATPase subunit type 1 TsaE [Candidatus Omnitrophota bacterium]
MDIISYSVAQTINIGKRIAASLKPADIVCLIGELGSGKTVLTKGIAGGLGIDKDSVISPTFVLIRVYEKGRLPLYHFDFFRLEESPQIAGLGYEEYLYGRGVSVIEWAQRLDNLMPREFLKIEISLKAGTERLLKFSASGLRYKELLGEIRENISH